MKYQPLDIARQFLYVREAGQNKGQRVNGIQQWCADDHGEGQSCRRISREVRPFSARARAACSDGERPCRRSHKGAAYRDRAG